MAEFTKRRQSFQSFILSFASIIIGAAAQDSEEVKNIVNAIPIFIVFLVWIILLYIICNRKFYDTYEEIEENIDEDDDIEQNIEETLKENSTKQKIDN